MKKILALMLVLMTIMLLFSGCMVVNKYDQLITAYQNAQKAAANGYTALSLGYNKIQNYMDMYQAYLTADVAKTQAYRDALNNYGTKIAEQQQYYTNDDNQPIDPSKIDLNELVQNGATPTGLAINISSYVNQFTEAPLEGIDENSLKDTMDFVQESYNEINSAVQDWNEAVSEYNTIRQQVGGDIVGRVATALGVRQIPDSLPYYSPTAPTDMPKMKTSE